MHVSADFFGLGLSLLDLFCFHLMVALLPKAKSEPKGKGIQRDLVKDKFQAIAKDKSKEKEKEQEPSAVADKQLAALLQCFHNTGVPEDVDAKVLKHPSS
ncbi:hypothetical protein C0995_013662 [Termitomyces sp. Mi166|nr:hypothetical protein C0995_013662 [Termitomyces sp. Mi166\